MRVAVLGSGMMGSVIARDLASSNDVDSVVVADVDEERLAKVRKLTPGRKLTTESLDVQDTPRAIGFFREFDVISSALPHGVVNAANRAAVAAGAKMVDIAFEDAQMEMGNLARKHGAMLIPGCGLAPGLSGIILAHALRNLDEKMEGHILVGGLPQHPRPPFGYRLVFSIVGLLREYLEDARVVRKGKVVKVRPFDTIEAVNFPKPIGKLEAFCTDGLATLLYTVKDIKEMDEKTLRWPGHAQKIQLLIEAGFFSDEKIEANGREITPLKLSYEVLSRKLKQGEPEDVTVMRVEAKGRKGAKSTNMSYEMIDFYDNKLGVTSMGRTTGYTCSIVTQMVGRGEIRDKGVVPPETALKAGQVKKLLSGLESRGVAIQENRR
jgi:lysine 6-dehydrogenase